MRRADLAVTVSMVARIVAARRAAGNRLVELGLIGKRVKIQAEKAGRIYSADKSNRHYPLGRWLPLWPAVLLRDISPVAAIFFIHGHKAN